MTETPFTIVVVGGVAGGASAAARARRCRENAHIIIFEKDGYASFANCGLPYYLGGEIEDREKLVVAKPALFKNRFNIDVRTRHLVSKINRSAKTVSVRNLETGECFDQTYNKLVLAPGATPFVPPIDGCDAPNVFTLRNLEDTDRIKTFLDDKTPAHAVVVGAGFIGLELVEQLHGIGIAVTLVELAPQVLPPLDLDMARIIEEGLEQSGVALLLGTGLKSISTEDGKATGVVLDDGTSIIADVIFLGMGVRPNTELAKDADLAIGATGGIAINDHCQTTDPDIYAAGDAVEYTHGILGTEMRVPLAGPANRAGRIAGRHAATGTSETLGPVYGTAILRVMGTAAGITGLSLKAARKTFPEARAVVISAASHASYYPGAKPIVLKLVYDPGDGRVLGAQAAGDDGVDKRLDVIATALRFGATVRDLAELDLAYAPPFGSAKDPVHLAAFVACNDMDGLTPIEDSSADLDGVQLVDVRTNQEVSACAYHGAIHIPIDELRDRIGELDPSKPTVVACQSGLRAHTGARLLAGRGFTQVKNLTGGMMMRRRNRPDTVMPKK